MIGFRRAREPGG
jgi:hypothetical protein